MARKKVTVPTISMSAFTQWSAHTMAGNYKKWGWIILTKPEYDSKSTTWKWTMKRGSV